VRARESESEGEDLFNDRKYEEEKKIKIEVVVRLIITIMLQAKDDRNGPFASQAAAP
jgi:hypothetical protein